MAFNRRQFETKIIRTTYFEPNFLHGDRLNLVEF